MSARAFDYDAYADLPATKGRYAVRLSFAHPLADPDHPLYGSGRAAAVSLHNKFFDRLTSTDEELRRTEWSALTDVVANGAASNAVSTEARDNRRLDASKKLATGDFAYSSEQTDSIVAWLVARTEATSTAVEQRFLEINVSDALARIERDEIALLAGRDEHSRANVDPTLLAVLEASPAVEEMKRHIGALYLSTETVDDLSYERYLGDRDAEDLRIAMIDAATRGVDPNAHPEAYNRAIETLDLPESAPNASGEADRLTPDNRAEIVAAMLGSEVARRGADARNGVKSLDADRPGRPNALASLIFERSALETAIALHTGQPANRTTLSLLDAAAFGHAQDATTPDPLARGTIETPAFAAYRAAAQTFAASMTPGANPLAILRAELLAGRGDPLERVDFVANTREEAEIAKAWTEFAAREGARVPSREAVAAFARGLEDSLSKPVTRREPTPALLAIPRHEIQTTKEFWDGLAAGKTLAQLEAEGVQRHVPINHPTWAAFYQGRDTVRVAGENGFETLVIAKTQTLRPAMIGPESSQLFFPVHAMDGGAFFKNAAAVDAAVAAIASANAETPAHQRTAIAVPTDIAQGREKGASSVIAMIRSAAEKAGFETLPVAVDAVKRTTRVVGRDGPSYPKTVRSMELTTSVLDPATGASTRVSLFSRDGQKAARGKLLLLVPGADAASSDEPTRQDSQTRALLRQAVAAIATQATIFGPTRNDAHAAHAIRNIADLRKPLTVIDAKGAETPIEDALKLARTAAPKRRDSTRLTFDLDTAFRSLADAPVSSDLGRFLVARASDFRQADRLASHPAAQGRTIGDLARAASHPTTVLIKPETPEQVADSRLARAMGGNLRQTFADIRALRGAVETADEMRRRLTPTTQTLFHDRDNPEYRGPTYRLDASSAIARAAGQPVIVRALPGVEIPTPVKPIAILGDGARPTTHVAARIEKLVHAAGANGHTIVTTADPLGAAVVDAAATTRAKVILVSSSPSYAGLSDASARRFAAMGLEGRALFVSTDLEPAKAVQPNPVMSRLSELDLAANLSSGVVLASARRNDPSVYVSATAGASQTLIPQAGKPVLAIPGTSGADDLAHAGSASFRAGRGGSGDASAAVLFLDADGKPDKSRREIETGVITHETWRSTSWTRPIARPATDDKDIALFLGLASSEKSAPQRNAGEKPSLTAADMRLLTGAVRYATPSEIYETGGAEYREAKNLDYSTSAMRELANALNTRATPKTRIASQMAEINGPSR